MGLKNSIMHVAGTLMVERPGKSKSYDQWIEQLERDGQAVEQRAATAKDTAGAAERMRHITGIERWGQRRLCVLLGEPFVRDEYDGYQPAADLPLPEQIAAFHATRQATLDTARKLKEQNIPDTARVEHNDFGPLSPRGWLSYLSTHANIESKRLK